MREFLKWFTIARMVSQIVQNFIDAGGPSVNPVVVANEVSKELVRKVAAGYLPADMLDWHEEIIQEAIALHPDIPLPPQAPKKNGE